MFPYSVSPSLGTSIGISRQQKVLFWNPPTHKTIRTVTTLLLCQSKTLPLEDRETPGTSEILSAIPNLKVVFSIVY